MRALSFTRQFKRDVKAARRRGRNISKLKEVLSALMEERQLDARYKDHPLRGPFAEYRECHIEPDWLLIYKLIPGAILFARTGSHSDLFG